MLKAPLGGPRTPFPGVFRPRTRFSTLVAFRSRSRPLRRAWGVHLRAAADAIRRGGASTVIAARRMAPTPRATGGRDPPRARDAARGPCFASRRVWGDPRRANTPKPGRCGPTGACCGRARPRKRREQQHGANAQAQAAHPTARDTHPGPARRTAARSRAPSATSWSGSARTGTGWAASSTTSPPAASTTTAKSRTPASAQCLYRDSHVDWLHQTPLKDRSEPVDTLLGRYLDIDPDDVGRERQTLIDFASRGPGPPEHDEAKGQRDQHPAPGNPGQHHPQHSIKEPPGPGEKGDTDQGQRKLYLQLGRGLQGRASLKKH